MINCPNTPQVYGVNMIIFLLLIESEPPSSLPKWISNIFDTCNLVCLWWKSCNSQWETADWEALATRCWCTFTVGTFYSSYNILSVWFIFLLFCFSVQNTIQARTARKQRWSASIFVFLLFFWSNVWSHEYLWHLVSVELLLQTAGA